jgi:glycosyltransferase involved in cell wall biosynthesis
LKVAAIIPAYNEAERIGPVLDAVTKSQLVEEVIVVSDGSRDATVQVAQRYPNVRVVSLPRNLGKGAAMCAGVKNTDASVIVFIDADLVGLRVEHVDQILRPLLEGWADMSIGVFRGGEFWSDAAQRISPYISGQRAIRRSLFESIPYLAEMRMGVEVAINTWAKRQRAVVTRVVLRGVSNTFKEKKMGLVRGTAARAKMYAEIGRAIVRTHRR